MNFITGYVLGSRMVGRRVGMVASAETFAPSSSLDIDKVSDRVDRMAMVMEAMWSLLEEGGYTREQLTARLEELDAADGATDGRISRPPGRCPQCDSAVSAGAKICQICGWQNPDVDPLASI